MAGREISFCVFTTHSAGAGDSTPRRFISDKQLTYYRRAEVVAVVCVSLGIGVVFTGLILLVCATKLMLIGS